MSCIAFQSITNNSEQKVCPVTCDNQTKKYICLVVDFDFRLPLDYDKNENSNI